MGKYDTAKIRNLGIIAHGGAGKTSLSEAILFDAGMIDRLGRVRPWVRPPSDSTARKDGDSASTIPNSPRYQLDCRRKKVACPGDTGKERLLVTGLGGTLV